MYIYIYIYIHICTCIGISVFVHLVARHHLLVGNPPVLVLVEYDIDNESICNT